MILTRTMIGPPRSVADPSFILRMNLMKACTRKACGVWCAGDAAARIEQLLLGSITSPQEASRLCAVQWANRLFPFHHVAARYICALAAGDVKLEIREEGQTGLQPPKPPPGNPPSLQECFTQCLLLTKLAWAVMDLSGQGKRM